MAARFRNRRWQDAVEISAAFVGLLFLMEILDWLLPVRLDFFGIVPRTLPGLIGILFSPLLHANMAHLLANAAPLFVLMTLLFMDRDYHPEQTIIWIWLASGFGTWLIGRTAIHIGASSLIYGLVVYLVASAWWMRSWRSAFVALGVFFFYGGLVYGMLPQTTPQKIPISWEGHLAGAIAGWWTARNRHG